MLYSSKQKCDCLPISKSFVYLYHSEILLRYIGLTRRYYRLLDSLVVEYLLRVRVVPGSIPSEGTRHTKDVKKMVPVVPLFSTEHSKGKILALSQE